MFAIITYKYVGGASSGEPVLKVGFSDTVVFDLERKYGTAPVNGEIRDTYFRVSENDTSLITKCKWVEVSSNGCNCHCIWRS